MLTQKQAPYNDHSRSKTRLSLEELETKVSKIRIRERFETLGSVDRTGLG